MTTTPQRSPVQTVAQVPRPERTRPNLIHGLAALMGLERHLLWLYKRWRGLMLVMLVGFMVGLVLAFVLPDNYDATLVVEPSSGENR